MLIRLLRTHLRGYRKVLLVVVVLQAVQTGATLALPTLNARIIDIGILRHNRNEPVRFVEVNHGSRKKEMP